MIIMIQKYNKLQEIQKEKEVGIEGLQPNTILHDYSKLLNQKLLRFLHH